MTAYELSYVLVIVILVYRAAHNLVLFSRNRAWLFLLYFVLTQLAFSVYLFLVLQTINRRNPADALLFERVENAVLPIMSACFLMFTQTFREVFSRVVLWVLVALFAIFTVVILVHPSAYTLELSAPKHFEWLGVTIYETHQPPIVLGLFVTMLGVLVRVLVKYIFEDSLYRTKSRFLVLALVVIGLTAVVDILVAAGIVHFPYTSHLGIVVVLFAVEHLFSFEIRYNPELAPAVREAAQRVAIQADEPVRRTPGSAPVQIHCLGPLRVVVEGREVPFTGFSRKKKLLRLLKLLLLRYGKWLHKEETLHELWPDLSEKSALNNLHALCFRLRKVLGHNEALVFAEDRLFLNRHIVEVDAHHFEAVMEQADRAFRSGDQQAALEAIEKGEQIYRGDFFEFDPYFEGAELMRTNLRMRLSQNLLRLCRWLEETERFEELVQHAERAVKLDALNEESWRTYFLALQKAGRKNEALRQFEEFRRILKKEVDTEPDGETLDVIRGIRAGDED